MYPQRAQAADTSKPKLQKSILSHAHAVAYVNMTTDELHHLSSCHLESLSMKHASCLVTNFASAPIFELAKSDYALSLHTRMHLQCCIARFFSYACRPVSESTRHFIRGA